MNRRDFAKTLALVAAAPIASSSATEGAAVKTESLRFSDCIARVFPRIQPGDYKGRGVASVSFHEETWHEVEDQQNGLEIAQAMKDALPGDVGLWAHDDVIVRQSYTRFAPRNRYYFNVGSRQWPATKPGDYFLPLEFWFTRNKDGKLTCEARFLNTSLWS